MPKNLTTAWCNEYRKALGPTVSASSGAKGEPIVRVPSFLAKGWASLQRDVGRAAIDDVTIPVDTDAEIPDNPTVIIRKMAWILAQEGQRAPLDQKTAAKLVEDNLPKDHPHRGVIIKAFEPAFNIHGLN